MAVVCDFQHDKTKSAMAQKFLVHMLPRRGPDAFEKFIAALMNCEQQQFIAKYLDPELASKYDCSGDDSPDAGRGDFQACNKTDDEIIQEVIGKVVSVHKVFVLLHP